MVAADDFADDFCYSSSFCCLDYLFYESHPLLPVVYHHCTGDAVGIGRDLHSHLPYIAAAFPGTVGRVAAVHRDSRVVAGEACRPPVRNDFPSSEEAGRAAATFAVVVVPAVAACSYQDIPAAFAGDYSIEVGMGVVPAAFA